MGYLMCTDMLRTLLFPRSTVFKQLKLFQQPRTMATLSPLPSKPIVIKPSEAEITNGNLESRNLEIAVRQIYLDGLVVVEDVIPHSDINHLNEKMIQDARKLQAMKEKSPFNYNQGNLQQDAPPVAEFFQTSIFASELEPYQFHDMGPY
jgi:hypothetical protein